MVVENEDGGDAGKRIEMFRHTDQVLRRVFWTRDASENSPMLDRRRRDICGFAPAPCCAGVLVVMATTLVHSDHRSLLGHKTDGKVACILAEGFSSNLACSYISREPVSELQGRLWFAFLVVWPGLLLKMRLLCSEIPDHSGRVCLCKASSRSLITSSSPTRGRLALCITNIPLHQGASHPMVGTTGCPCTHCGSRSV